jgi:hypothetical protein
MGRHKTTSRGAVLAAIVWLSVSAGCSGQPLPRSLTPAACGDRCASTVCPAAYRCTVDEKCVERCQPEQVGNRP